MLTRSVSVQQSSKHKLVCEMRLFQTTPQACNLSDLAGNRDRTMLQTDLPGSFLHSMLMKDMLRSTLSICWFLTIACQVQPRLEVQHEHCYLCYRSCREFT